MFNLDLEILRRGYIVFTAVFFANVYIIDSSTYLRVIIELSAINIANHVQTLDFFYQVIIILSLHSLLYFLFALSITISLSSFSLIEAKAMIFILLILSPLKAKKNVNLYCCNSWRSNNYKENNTKKSKIQKIKQSGWEQKLLRLQIGKSCLESNREKSEHKT